MPQKCFIFDVITFQQPLQQYQKQCSIWHGFRFVSAFFFAVAICHATSMLLLNVYEFFSSVVWHFKQQDTARHCHWMHAIDNYAWYNTWKSTNANCFELPFIPILIVSAESKCRNATKMSVWLGLNERITGIRNWNSSLYLINPILRFEPTLKLALSRNCLILSNVVCAKRSHTILNTMKTHLSTIQRVCEIRMPKSCQHIPQRWSLPTHM